MSAALDVIPYGFYRQAEYGLGLAKVYLPLIKQIERLPNVTRLVVSKVRPTALDGASVVLSHEQVEEALTFLQKVADRHQRRSLQERNAHVRNQLVSPLDPITYPEEVPPYTEDTIFEALAVVRDAKLKLSAADNVAIVSEVGKRVGDLKEHAPEQLFRLHRDIELVNLDILIDKFKRLLSLPQEVEKRWQKLFDLNPFILSMVFGYPVVKVLREAAVGGPLLDGRGAKFADFLAKNPTTSNAALVELKTPQTKLLASKPYRGEPTAHPVYAPHPKLTGAVAQVLDQRYRLQKDISTHISNNNGLVLRTYHVDCVVVAGLAAQDDEQRQAFEIYRQSLKDVRIVTFDELLIKLESLRALLATLPEAASDDGDDYDLLASGAIVPSNEDEELAVIDDDEMEDDEDQFDLGRHRDDVADDIF